MVRLSTLLATERHPAREVRLDETGDHVHRGTLGREDQVDADRARLLRQHRERRFHFALHRHHEVGQLVHDDDDVGQHAFRVHLRLRRGWRGVGRFGIHRRQVAHRGRRMPEWLPFMHLAIEVGYIARAVGVQETVAPAHFPHRPLEHRGRVAAVGHHLVPHVGQRIVHAELDHLWIHHQEPEVARGVAVHQPGDERVDGDRLA
jgi:hypothetical protein